MVVLVAELLFGRGPARGLRNWTTRKGLLLNRSTRRFVSVFFTQK